MYIYIYIYHVYIYIYIYIIHTYTYTCVYIYIYIYIKGGRFLLQARRLRAAELHLRPVEPRVDLRRACFLGSR